MIFCVPQGLYVEQSVACFCNLVGQALQLEAQDYWGERSETLSLQEHADLENLTTTDFPEMLRYLDFLKSKRGSSGSTLDISVIVGASGGSTLSFRFEELFEYFPELNDTSEEIEETVLSRYSMKDTPKS